MGHGRAVLGELHLAGLLLGDALQEDFFFGRKLRAQHGDLQIQGLALPLQPALLGLDLLLPEKRLGLLLGFLRQPGGAGQHARRPEIDVHQFDAAIGQPELAQLVGMGHAAGFQEVHGAVAFASQLDVAQQQPGIHQRRDADIGLLGGAAGEAREHHRDLVGLEEVDQPHEHRLDLVRRAGGG